MKKILSLILAAGVAFSSCQQVGVNLTTYKPMTDEKSIALKSITSSLMVDLKNGVAHNDEFLDALRTELRQKGWRLIVDGFTGRAGDTQSVNSGAAYTLIYNAAARPNEQAFLVLSIFGIPLWLVQGCPPLQDYILNISIVENKTGEEVVVIQGVSKDAKETARKLAESMDKYTKKIEQNSSQFMHSQKI